MTGSVKNRLLAAFAVFAVLLAGSGCGRSEESTTSSKVGSSVREQTMESDAAPKQKDQTGARHRDRGQSDADRYGNKAKADDGEGKTAATNTGRNDDSEQPADVPKRVRELIEGDSGTQVVDSGRELKKVLREIKRSKQREGVPPVVEEILEEARGG
ncbi:MAG TPA: hypothetical protein VFZ29_03260 [Solirubrobacterales bacterium]